jgi:hypothetical protein
LTASRPCRGGFTNCIKKATEIITEDPWRTPYCKLGQGNFCLPDILVKSGRLWMSDNTCRRLSKRICYDAR